MPSQWQQTISKSVSALGIGLHSGTKVNLVLNPAPADTGIVFRRVDVTPSVDIPGRALLVTETRMNSGLSKDGVKINTVEHLMSALAGLEIDNCLVEIDAPEIPVMDGSASAFVVLLGEAQITTQPKFRQYLKIIRPITIAEDDKWVRLEPFTGGFNMTFHIKFDHPVVQSTGQSVSYLVTPQNYLKEIGRARTFGFMKEFEALRAVKLGLGATLDNAVAVDEYKVLNADGLRYSDEFARHKILDALGDLYLLGHPVLGAYSAYKSGHALNNRLARAVLQQPDAWRLVTLPGVEQAKPVWITRMVEGVGDWFRG